MGDILVLTEADRFAVWQSLMQQWSKTRTRTPTGKSELRSVVDAVDDDLTSQPKAYIKTLVTPAKGDFRVFLERLASSARELVAIAQEYPAPDIFTVTALDEAALLARIPVLKSNLSVAKFSDALVLDILKDVAHLRADRDL